MRLKCDTRYTIQGERFTMSEACERFNCSIRTFYRRRSEGRLHELPNTERNKRDRSHLEKRHSVKGEYLTIKEAARKYNKSISQVRTLQYNGRLDDIDKPSRKGAKTLKVYVRGIEFESAKACAEHNRVKTKTVYEALREGEPDRIGRYTNPNYQQEMEEYLCNVDHVN